MRRVMARLPEVTSAEARAVRRLVSHLAEAPDLASLGRELVAGAARIVPADLMLWNVWTPDLGKVLEFESNDGRFRELFTALMPALEATVQYHPIVAADLFEETRQGPQRLSDYQSVSAFRSNPLFSEVYRHVDSHYQLAYTPARLADRQILLNWNRRHRDFTSREVQLLHLLGLPLEQLCRRIEERRHLQLAWGSLLDGLEQLSGSAGTLAVFCAELKPRDGKILSGLIRGESRAAIASRLGCRRDTLDRYLGALRERLGLENTAQLLQALGELRPGTRP